MKAESQQSVDTSAKITGIKHCEGVILGALILDDECWEGISKEIDERDFLFEANRLLFHAIRVMKQDGTPVTVKALRDLMRHHIQVPGTSLPQYLEWIVASARPGAYAITCANILKSRDAQYDESVAHVGSHFTGRSSGFMNETSLLRQVVADLEMAHAFSTGKRDAAFWLEDITSCLKTEWLIALTGNNEQQNMILASTLVHQLIFKKNNTCGVFCQDAKEFYKVQLALTSGVGIKKLHTGELSDDDLGKVVHALGLSNEAPLFLEQLPTSFELLKESIRRYARRCEKESSNGKDSPALVLNLHRLFNAPGSDEMTPFVQALHELKELAIVTGVPIIVAHHAMDKDAQGEFAAISQCADVVLSLESPTNENASPVNLTIYIKGNPLSSKVRLLFDSEMFTVKPELIEKPSAD